MFKRKNINVFHFWGGKKSQAFIEQPSKRQGLPNKHPCEGSIHVTGIYEDVFSGFSKYWLSGLSISYLPSTCLKDDSIKIFYTKE